MSINAYLSKTGKGLLTQMENRTTLFTAQHSTAQHRLTALFSGILNITFAMETVETEGA